MFVRRSEVSCFRSIQRDSAVTGEKAMSASLEGSGTAALGLRTNASRAGPAASRVRAGFHRVAGATCGSNVIFLGPTRRSRSGAIDCRQLAAAISRSAALIVTCASCSASANVTDDTGGPDTGAVPKVGGAPGVAGGAETTAGGRSRRQATAAPTTPIGAVIRNCRRVFIFFLSEALSYRLGRASQAVQYRVRRLRPRLRDARFARGFSVVGHASAGPWYTPGTSRLLPAVHTSGMATLAMRSQRVARVIRKMTTRSIFREKPMHFPSRTRWMFTLVLAFVASSGSYAAEQTRQASTDSLIYDLKNPDAPRRQSAVRDLGIARFLPAIPALLPLAEDP